MAAVGAGLLRGTGCFFWLVRNIFELLSRNKRLERALTEFVPHLQDFEARAFGEEVSRRLRQRSAVVVNKQERGNACYLVHV